MFIEKRCFVVVYRDFVISSSRIADGRMEEALGRRVVIEVTVIAAIGLIMAALGPFGSYAIPLEQRALLWIALILAGYAIFRPMLVVARWLSQASGIGSTPAKLVALTLGSLPLSMLVGFTLNWLGAKVNDTALHTYLQVWGIGLGITLFMDRFLPRPSPAMPPDVPRGYPINSPRLNSARFLDRIPPGFGPKLLCLSMEDHYVRAHGAGGSVLILMRMRDAVEELVDVQGLRVHRSWWVAVDAVEGVERDGERMRLRLVNGLIVPVARSHSGAVRAQGWRQI
jgi:hypothetical protein